MKNFSLFIIGIIMIVFAGMFHIYRHGRTMAKAPPPPPPKPLTPPMTARPSPIPPKPTPSTVDAKEKPLAPPPVQKTTGSQPGSPSSQGKVSSSKTQAEAPNKIKDTTDVSTISRAEVQDKR
jgi:ubiquinol-cytochrome c reductase cytochrome b subunit